MEKELSAANMERYFVFALQDDDTYAVTSYNRGYIEKDAVATLVIPSTYDGRPVTVIGENAFEGLGQHSFGTNNVGQRLEVIACRTVKNIVIPDSVTTIANSAFGGCEELTSIEIGKGVKQIGQSTFSFCKSLSKINIPDGTTFIGVGAFSHCESLTEISIPDSVTEIGGKIFDECSALKSINIGNGITDIEIILGGVNSKYYGVNPFKLTSVTNLSVGKSVNNLSNIVFKALPNLTTLNIDSENPLFYVKDGILYSKADKTLLKCFKVPSVFTVPSGIKNIDEYAFAELKTLTEVILPDSVTKIADFMFANCPVLTKIKIPESVTEIGRHAFDECMSLTQLIIPASVKVLGEKIVSRCKKFQAIYYKGTKAQWESLKKYSLGDGYINVYYYSDKGPSSTDDCWHYAADGVTPEIIPHKTGFMSGLLKKLGFKD